MACRWSGSHWGTVLRKVGSHRAETVTDNGTSNEVDNRMTKLENTGWEEGSSKLALWWNEKWQSMSSAGSLSRSHRMLNRSWYVLGTSKVIYGEVVR